MSGDLCDRGPEVLGYAGQHFGAWVALLSLYAAQVRWGDRGDLSEIPQAVAELRAPAPDGLSLRLHKVRVGKKR